MLALLRLPVRIPPNTLSGAKAPPNARYPCRALDLGAGSEGSRGGDLEGGGERGHRRPISLDAWVAGGGAAGAVRACMLEEDGRGKAQEAECNVLLVFQCNHKLLQLSAAGRSEPV